MGRASSRAPRNTPVGNRTPLPGQAPLLVSRHRSPVSTEGADAPLWEGGTTSDSSVIARRSNAARVDAAAREPSDMPAPSAKRANLRHRETAERSAGESQRTSVTGP